MCGARSHLCREALGGIKLCCFAVGDIKVRWNEDVCITTYLCVSASVQTLHLIKLNSYIFTLTADRPTNECRCRPWLHEQSRDRNTLRSGIHSIINRYNEGIGTNSREQREHTSKVGRAEKKRKDVFFLKQGAIQRSRGTGRSTILYRTATIAVTNAIPFPSALSSKDCQGNWVCLLNWSRCSRRTTG